MLPIEKIIIFYEDREKWIHRMSSLGYKKIHLLKLSKFLEPKETIFQVYHELQLEIKKAGYPISVDMFETDDLPGADLTNSRSKNARVIFWNITDGIYPYTGSYIPGYTALLGMKHFGNSTYTQSIAQDKFVFSITCERLGVRQPSCILARGVNPISKIPDGFGRLTSFFVKPRNLDNAIGINSASTCSSLSQAFSISEKLNRDFGVDSLIQEYIEGNDVRVSFLNSENSSEPWKECDVFFCKKPRIKGKTPKVLSELDEETLLTVRTIVEKMVIALGLKDIFSLDFRVDDSKRCYLLELNTSPFISGDEFQSYLTTRLNRSVGDAVLRALLNSASHSIKCG